MHGRPVVEDAGLVGDPLQELLTAGLILLSLQVYVGQEEVIEVMSDATHVRHKHILVGLKHNIFKNPNVMVNVEFLAN